MEHVTPKLRFRIAPGSSARMAEEERRTAEASPQTQIRSASAARMAESEEPAAPQRPYSIRMQARTGVPFTLTGDADATSTTGLQGHAFASPSELSEWGSEDESPQAAIPTLSFRPDPERDQVSISARNVLILEEDDSTTKGQKETRTQRRTPFQTLRSLFSRKSPRQ
jgi:hypothetical protein